MFDRLQEALDVRIQHPVHLPLGDPDPDRVQRLMRAALRPEPVAGTVKVLLVDLVQHPYRPLLDDLILQRGDPDWPLTTLRFGLPYPLRRLCPISAPLHPVMEIRYPALPSLTVLLPCHVVYSGCSVALKRFVCLPKPLRRDMGNLPPCSAPSSVLRRCQTALPRPCEHLHTV